MQRPSSSATQVEGVDNPDPFEPQMGRLRPQQPAVPTDGYVPVRCVCNRLLCEALPGSTVKIVCPRCGALILWPARGVEVLPREKPRRAGEVQAALRGEETKG
jgi:hypothetical protein